MRHIKLKDIFIKCQSIQIEQIQNLIVHKYDFDKINKENVRLLTDQEIQCIDRLRDLENQT